MEPNIGLVPNDRDAVAKLLNILLSDEYILLVKTKKLSLECYRHEF